MAHCKVTFCLDIVVVAALVVVVVVGGGGGLVLFMLLLLLLFCCCCFVLLSVLSTCVKVIKSHLKSRNQNSSEIDRLRCQDVQLSRAFNQGQDGGCQGSSLRRQQDEWKADRARAGHSLIPNYSLSHQMS